VAINSLVELLPQSSAATVSPTHVDHVHGRDLHFVRHKFTYGVLFTSEEIRQVRVQTLHTHPGAANAARRLDAASLDRCRESSLRVVVVRSLQLRRVDERLEAVHATIALEATHGIV
jgi:hypothetical protein